MCTVGTGSPNLDRNRGCGVTQDSRGSCSTKHPINTAVANKFRIETDLVPSGSSPLRFERAYNSRGRRSSLIGFHWLHTYDRQISFHALAGASISNAKALRPDGNASYFNLVSGVWTPVTLDITESLTVSQDTGGNITGAVYTLNDGSVETYDQAVSNNGIVVARLHSIRDQSGMTQTLGYDSLGRLATVTDSFGYALTFAYDANGRVGTLTDPNGKITSFTYDAHQNLTQVSYPDHTAKVYYYENTAFPTNLTGIGFTDTAGVTTRYATFGYDTNGMANASQLAGGQEAVTVTYSPSSASAISSATVTDAASNQEVLTFGVTLGVVNLASKQLYDPYGTPIGSPLTQTFDANNNLTCKQDEAGHVTTYGYNSTNQKTSMTEGQGGSCQSPTTIAGVTRTTWYQYLSPTLDLPTSIQSPSVYGSGYKTVTIGYGDANHPLLPTTIIQSGHTPSGAAVSRTVSLSYDPNTGQVSTINGPRSPTDPGMNGVDDITTLTYYNCATGGGCGQLQSVTNALGQTTTYDYYDGAGRVTQTTDPNGLKTVYGYDERGRVKSITETPAGGVARVTSFTYHPAGMVASSTDPDGVTTTYQYDAALQLRHILQPADNQGHFNDHAYAYDTRGNQNAESIYDASGTLVRTEGRVFDARNHLWTVTRAGVVTTTVNDALGVLLKLTDGNNHTTIYTPDALSRLYQAVDALNGATTYGYDVNDHATSVTRTLTSSNSLTTTYTVDDLGNVLSEISPDRGTITYTYDAAGNVLTRADANFTTTWTYDALNRVLSQQSSDSATGRYDYVYDICSRKGVLCNIQKNGSMHLIFGYDSFGRRNYELTSAWLFAQYTYTPAGRVKQITYPDGRTVDYTIDTAGQVSQVATTLNSVTTTLASSITYYPFGPVKSLTYGNNLSVTQFLDSAYRPTQRFDGSFFESLSQYDGADNILTRWAPSQQTYTYDAVNRLASASDGTSFGNLAWTYDLNGNRQSDTRNSTNTTYTYQPTGSNWLYQFGSNYRVQGYPGTTAYATGPGFLGYDGYLRLVSVNGTTASYTYDAFNRRLTKTVGSTTTRFQYGLNGELLAENDGTTTLDYVYLNGVPIARTGNGIYYYHTDHLGTPVQMTNSTGTVVWAAQVEPFGAVTLTTQTITNNLRFPGQYYDPETGLHYNWNRYYDPKIGRYVTSDPIGLDGGLNTYAYGNLDPLRYSDRLGLSTELAPDPPNMPETEEEIRSSSQTLLDLLPGSSIPQAIETGGLTGAAILMTEIPGLKGIRAAGKMCETVAKTARRFSKEKQALVDMAKADKRKGITSADMEAYKDLNKGLPDPFPSNKVRGPEAHPTGGPISQEPHGHVGPVDHIPIIDP